MPKRTARSRKRVHHRAKPSLFDKLFTFPKLAIYGFLILLVMFVYQISAPSKDVKGATTTAAYSEISDSQYDALVKSPANTSNYPRILNMRIWKDSDGDGKRNHGETVCPEKNYTVEINGNTRTKTQKANCGWNHINLTQEHNVVIFTTDLKNYTYSGMEYTDKYGKKQYSKSKKLDFTGGNYAEGGWYRYVSFGLKPK